MQKEIYVLKRAVISGASHALKYKERNPRALDSEVIQHVTREVEEILKMMDEGD
ncbi:MAG: hypothetical protein AABX73_01345 [Nanoarchaeota archaeon]